MQHSGSNSTQVSLGKQQPWTLVHRLLGALPHVAGIAQVTDRIITLMRTLFTAS